ncbi:MAG: glycosyltransferase family 4 protein [Pseudomonadota bacterium]|nr:glycosyltransferase family 4 protein [Pseudomonadota bacterium]
MAPLSTSASSDRLLTLVLPGDPLTATGGYEYDRRILEGLRALGWTTQVRTLDHSFPVPTAAALADAHQQLAALPANSLTLIDGLALGAMPDVVHAHAERLRMVGLVHHPLAAETGLSSELAAQLFESERRALAAMRSIVVTSQSTRRSLAAYGVAAHGVAVVEPGVDQPKDLEIDERPRSPSSAVRMLCVASVTERKGYDLLVDALAGLGDLDWTLTCVGDTERSVDTARALRMRIEANGQEHRIALTGELEGAPLHQQFRAAELFVLATRFEGYGMVIAQALTYGLPVVSTRTGAIAELVTPEAGLLVEPDDGAALREALSRVLSDADLRTRLAAGARAVGATLPGWSAASQQFSEILTAVAQRTDDSRAAP